MAQPKRRTSKSKRRMRQANTLKHPLNATSTCSQCGAPVQPHRVCTGCGTYRGRQVMTVAVDE